MAKKSLEENTKSTAKPPVANKPSISTPSVNLSQQNLKLIAAGVVLFCFAFLLWQYNKARTELKKQQNPQIAIQEEGEDTQAEVGKVMVLPTNETPTVANISDIGKLKDQPFFANAQNGDKVLIYKEARKAIIYRPSSKQIVEVATYNSGQEPAPQAN